MLTLERAIELAQQIVSENPDFVYNRPEDGSNFCFYVPLPVVRQWHDDDPEFRDRMFRTLDLGMQDMITMEPDPDRPREQTGCIVGRILDLAGETRHLDRTNHSIGVDGLNDKYDGMFADKPTVEFLSILQDRQDNGATWGDALEQALIRVRVYATDDALDEDAYTDADEY